MLTNSNRWNAENLNQVGPKQRLGGASKARKALGDAGTGSENAPISGSAKGPSFSKNSSRKQHNGRGGLGDRSKLGGSENAPQQGKGARRSDPKSMQRRALGDISNAGLGQSGTASNGSKLGGGKKSGVSGLAFAVHSDAKPSLSSNGGVNKTGGVKVERSVEKPSMKVWEEGPVEEVEVTLGRTGDEEEVMVQRKEEQRAAKMANPFRYATKCSRRPPPAVSLPAAPVAAFSSEVSTPSVPFAASAAAAESDENFELAIDRMVHDDFEGIMGLMTVGKEARICEPVVDELDLDWLVSGETAAVEELNSTPLSPLNDSFLTEEMEFNFV